MTKQPEKDKGLPGRPSLNMLPGVRDAMKAQGYNRVSSLWRAFKNAADMRQEDMTASYKNLLDITSGEGCFDDISGAYTPLAESVADFLNAQPVDLFGAMPNDPRAYDIDPDDLQATPRTEGLTQPEDHALQREREKVLAACFEKMALTDERGVQILRMRHGLNGDEPMKLEEVANTMNISMQRVRQIEMRATARLKALIIKSYAVPSAPDGWAPRYTLSI